MKHFLQHLGLAGGLCVAFGLVFGPAVLSIGVFLVFLHPFFNHKPAEIFNRLKSHTPALLLILLFFVNVMCFFYTENTNGYLENIRIKLPLLLLPIGFMGTYFYKKNTLTVFLYALITAVFAAAAFTFINYYIHYEEINQLQKLHQPVPIIGKINHIYYGMLLAFSILAGIWLLSKKLITHAFAQKILWFMLFVMFVFLHILASRTGLLAFYGTAILLAIKHLLIKKRFLILGFLLIIFISSAIFAWKIKSPLQEKLHFTWQDISTYLEGKNINDWSVSMRFASWEIAWKLFKKSPVFGVGMADLQQEMNEIYPERFPTLTKNNYKLPHNQFMQYLAGTGIVGILVLLTAFFYPLFFKKFIRFNLFLMLWLILLITFSGESALERQIGVSFFAFYWLLIINRKIFTAEEEKTEAAQT